MERQAYEMGNMCFRDWEDSLKRENSEMNETKLRKYVNNLIKEALEEKAPFAESGQNTLQIEPSIKNSYGVITKENEITRYSVTLNVEYRLYNKKTKKVVFKKQQIKRDHAGAWSIKWWL